MDNVYLIWSGEYSDKQVIAAYATEELAEQAMGLLRNLKDDDGYDISYRFDPLRIEEIELGKITPVLHWYRCILQKDGSIAGGGREFSPRLAADQLCSVYTDGDIRFSAYGTSEEHAIKNAADFRRAWLAAHPEALTK